MATATPSYDRQALLEAILGKCQRGNARDDQWPDSNGDFWPLNPLRQDEHVGSFSVGPKGFYEFSNEGEVKGGGLLDLAEKMGIDTEPYRAKKKARKEAWPGCTLPEYADAKKLDIEELKGWGLGQTKATTGVPIVTMSYLDEQGSHLATRYRVGLSKAGPRFRWAPNARAKGALYGLWRLAEIRAAGWALLVEGESDCHTAWHYGLPALGIPGVSNWHKSAAKCLKGLEVYVWQEPDAAGQAFALQLRADVPDAQVMQSEYKDLSEAHIAGADVPALIEELKASAQTLEQVTLDEDGRRVEVLSYTYHHERMKLYDRLLEAINKEAPTIFVHHGHLVVVQSEVVKTNSVEQRQPMIREVTKELLAVLLCERVNFVSIKSARGEEQITPTVPSVRDLAEYLSRGQWPFPALAGVIEAPTLRPDGTIIQAAGYDEATGLYHFCDALLHVPPVSDDPTEEERQKAISLLLEMLHDFPFVAKEQDGDEEPEINESLANALGLILTPVIKTAIDGDVPIAEIDSPQQGSGKGHLTDCAAIIATGHRAHVMTAPGHEEEMRKKLTALLMAGQGFVSVDNVTGTFDSAQLAAAVTCKVWQDRVLGTLEVVKVPMNAVFVINGNNVVLGGDLPRRCYPIRLDPKCARPWQRSGFLHDPLLPWVQENRGRLLWAVLTLARAWFVAGKPAGHVAPMATFTDWAVMVGGILELAGVRGFLGNVNEFYEASDPDQEAWHNFLIEWHEVLGDTARTVKDLTPYFLRMNEAGEKGELHDALPGEIADIMKDGHSVAKRLGRAFLRQNGRTYADGLRLEKAKIGDVSNKVARWRVTKAPEPEQKGFQIFDSTGFSGFHGVSGKRESFQEHGIDSVDGIEEIKSNVGKNFPSAGKPRETPKTPQTVDVGNNGYDDEEEIRDDEIPF